MTKTSGSYRKIKNEIVCEQWSQKNTACALCNRQMYFPNHESKTLFLSRIDDRGLLNETDFLILRQVTVDHILERRNNGGNRRDNLRLVCYCCNAIRNAVKVNGITDFNNYELG